MEDRINDKPVLMNSIEKDNLNDLKNCRKSGNPEKECRICL